MQKSKMFTQRTLDRILDQLDYNSNVDDLATDEELSVLKENGSLNSMCEHLYVDNMSFKVTKLFKYNAEEKFDLLKFVDHIIETIPFPFEISLNVGFFISHREELKYVRPSTTQSVINANIINLEHYWKVRKEILNVGSNIIQRAYETASDRRQIPSFSNPKHYSPALLCLYLKK